MDTSRIAEPGLHNIHPGEVLLKEFLEPLGISQDCLARALNVLPRTIYKIVSSRQGVTADIALGLARYFGTSERFWSGLQDDFDAENSV